MSCKNSKTSTLQAQSWRMMTFISFISLSWSIETTPTPPKVASYIEGNLYAETHHMKSHDLDISAYNTNWYADDWNSHESTIDQGNTPHLEEQTNSSMVPETWRNFQRGDRQWINQRLPVHETTIPYDQSSILSNCNSDSLIHKHPQDHQDLHEFYNQHGWWLNKDSSFGQTSQYGMMASQGGPPILGPRSRQWIDEGFPVHKTTFPCGKYLMSSNHNSDSIIHQSLNNCQNLHKFHNVHGLVLDEDLLFGQKFQYGMMASHGGPRISGPKSRQWIDQSLPVHETTFPCGKDMISSHYKPDSMIHQSLHTNQNLHEVHNPHGLMLDKDLSFGQTSQYGMMESQGGSSILEPEKDQNLKTVLHHMHNSESSLASDENDTRDLVGWKKSLDLHLNHLFSNIPFGSIECDVLDQESPRVPSPTRDMLQHDSLDGLPFISRTPFGDTDTSERHESPSTHGAIQTDNVGAIDNPSGVPSQFEPVSGHTRSSKGRKRLYVEDECPDNFTESDPSEVGNSKPNRTLKKPFQRKRQSKKKKRNQSKGVTDECIGKSVVLMPKSVKSSFVNSKETRTQQKVGLRLDKLRQCSKDIIVPVKKKKSEREDYIREPAQKTFRMLKEMGEFYVANSPNFAYKIHIWFRILREDMMKISGHKEGMQKSVNQAIECAQWWVTMGIFGIISIHFPPIGVNCAKLEKILEHAWEIIQAIFDQWRHMQVKDMKVQVCSRVVEEGHLLDPLHLFRYFVKLNDLTKIKSQILTSIILQYNKGSKTLKIDIDTVGKLYNKVQSLYNKDQMFIHGGFYSRARVGNLEYEAINSFSGPKKSTLGSKSLSRRVAECRLISQSAQFLSPVGINLCQKMSNCQSRIRYDSE